MAKKNKKADPSPTQDVAIREENYAKPDRKDGHPWRGTGKGNPKHSNLQKKCKAKNSRNEPCGLPPMAGQEVCGSHGGRAEQSKRKARERLDELADPAAYRLGQIMENSEDDSVRARAAVAILDRTGFSPRHSVAIEHEIKPYERVIQAMEEEQANPALAEARRKADEAYNERLAIEMNDDRY